MHLCGVFFTCDLPRPCLPSPTTLLSSQGEWKGTAAQAEQKSQEDIHRSRTFEKKEAGGRDGVIRSEAKPLDERRRGELYSEEKRWRSDVNAEEDLVEGIYSELTTTTTSTMPQPKEAMETPLTRHSTARCFFCCLEAFVPGTSSPLDRFLCRSSLKRSDSYKAARPILSPPVVRRSVESSTVSSAVTSPDTSVRKSIVHINYFEHCR